MRKTDAAPRAARVQQRSASATSGFRSDAGSEGSSFHPAPQPRPGRRSQGCESTRGRTRRNSALGSERSNHDRRNHTSGFVSIRVDDAPYPPKDLAARSAPAARPRASPGLSRPGNVHRTSSTPSRPSTCLPRSTAHSCRAPKRQGHIRRVVDVTVRPQPCAELSTDPEISTRLNC